MKTVTDAGGAAGEPVVFVKNELQIATPKNNPGGITGLSDFGKSALRIVVCAQAVPCGAAADKVFQAAGLTASIDSYEQDVKGVLTKVTTGEADAGLVYKTDVKSAGENVVGISFPESADAVNDYPIAVLTEAKNRDAAAAWVAYLSSDEARAAFQEAGFQVP
jgi:molybdate transport system substrate-binding protein